MSCISSFKIIKVVVFEVEPEPSTFFSTTASIAELAAVRPNEPSGFMTDFNNAVQFLIKDQEFCLNILQIELF